VIVIAAKIDVLFYQLIDIVTNFQAPLCQKVKDLARILYTSTTEVVVEVYSQYCFTSQ
jgi:hypothetical protein